MKLLILLSSILLSFGALVNLEMVPYVVLAPKETVDVFLESNPTTGYMWYIFPPESTSIQVVGDQVGVYVPPAINIPGYPGRQIFKIRCVSCNAGEAYDFTLALWRMGEQDPAQYRTFKVVVVNKQ